MLKASALLEGCGAAVKPIALRMVSNVAKSIPNAQIFGLGEVVSWYDAMEYLMVEVKAVQVVTGVIWYGMGVIDNLIEGTTRFLKENGYGSVQEVIGKALSMIIARSTLSSENGAVCGY